MRELGYSESTDSSQDGGKVTHMTHTHKYIGIHMCDMITWASTHTYKVSSKLV